QHGLAVAADNPPRISGGFQRQAKGATNQACPDDRDLFERHAQEPMINEERSQATFRPTAGAITRSSPTSWANCSGYRDCAPSESALSGQLWTSISRPSAPAAMAARPMGATLSRRPVPCEGSATIGRWESFLTMGMAEVSSVLRV